MELGPLGTAFVDAHFTTFHEKEAEGPVIPSPTRVNHSKKKTISRRADKAHAAFGPPSQSLPSFCDIAKHTTILDNSVLLAPRVFAFYILEHELLIMSIRIGRDVDDELD
jgi:hypothetical protein